MCWRDIDKDPFAMQKTMCMQMMACEFFFALCPNYDSQKDRLQNAM